MRDKWAVVVQLTCGHKIRIALPPSRRAKFACEANAGCGYRLGWVSAHKGDSAFNNEALEGSREHR